MNELTISELQLLGHCEGVIEKGLNTFVEVGEALATIRDGKLYRQVYNTFDHYCRERWGMASRTAYQLIDASSVVENVRNCAQIQPANESQARPLSKLPPDQQIEAWQEVIETAPNGKVTAAHVQQVVDSVMGVHYSSKTDEWETPQDLFDILNNEFSFTLDVCALDSNAKCKKYFTPQMDGLAEKWHDDICWMNPPYGNEISYWIEQAFNTGFSGGVVVCLVPARVDTNWWWDYCIYGEIRFLKGRLKFGDSNNSAPFPSAIVIFRGNEPSVNWWNWKE